MKTLEEINEEIAVCHDMEIKAKNGSPEENYWFGKKSGLETALAIIKKNRESEG